MFYKTFTGNDKRPEKIKRFGDIPMNTYNQDTMCDVPGISADAFTGSEHTYNYMNNLLIQYAENLRNMISKANQKQLQLIGILNSLFAYRSFSKDHGNMPTIHPELTTSSLDDLMRSITRKLVTSLYFSCEEDYLRGVEIYEAILENKILTTSKKQIAFLSDLRDIVKST